jgi:glyoxylase-like metal-dependent hydrolase (beta-lactamase superfamily II)
MRTPLVLLVLLASSSPLAAARAADAPGVHRMKLGDVEIVALRDAAGPRPLDKLIANPEEIPKAGVAKPDDPAMLQVNTFLVVSGASLTLIDSGNGGEAGQTLANLKAAGYRPEQVTAVLLTHLHGDHVGGMLADGKPTFPTPGSIWNGAKPPSGSIRKAKRPPPTRAGTACVERARTWLPTTRRAG